MWFILSLGNAFYESISDALSKSMVQKLDIVFSSFVIRLCVFLMFIPVWFLFDRTISKDGYFWIFCLGTTLLNTIAILLYMKALQESDLSLCLPILKFSPVWTLLTAPLINGESIGLFGSSGIFIMILGAYLMNLSQRSQGFFAPFTIFWRDKGMRSMLFVSLLWSVSAPLDKEAIRHASPLFFMMVLNGLLTLAFIPVVIAQSSFAPLKSLRVIGTVIPRGLASVLSIGCQMFAFSMAPVPIVFQLSDHLHCLVCCGAGFFLERKISEREL